MNGNLFGVKLREFRERAGLTQPQLAERAGLSKAGVADLEQGRREPTWGTVQALADALGVSCDDFRKPPAAGAPPRGRGRPPKGEPEPPKRGKGKK